MKKHFLLLVMALMSVSTWAADLRTVEALNPYYGELPVLKVYSEGATALGAAYYTVDGYFTDEACTEANKLTEAQVKTKDAGTILYVKVTGKGDYTGTVIGSFTVRKMPLLIYGTAGTSPYNGAEPTGTIFTLATSSAIKVKTAGTDLTDALKTKITFTKVAGVDAAQYAINGTITDATYAKNYTVESEDVLVASTTTQAMYEITAKGFVEGSTAIVVTVTSNLTYNNKAQTPTIEVKDMALNQTLTAGTDYVITYEDASGTADAHITAGSHHVRLTGKGNYKTADKIQKTFTIAAAPLLVTPYASKVYANAKAVPTIPANVTSFTEDVYFTFQGFVDDKTASDVTWTGTTTWSSSDAKAPAGTYKLNFNTGNDIRLANYVIKPQEGVYTIKKKAINVQADDANIDYGEPEVYAVTAATITSCEGATDKGNMPKVVKITRAEAAETTGAHAGAYKLTPIFKTDDEIDADVEADETVGAGKTGDELTAAKTAEKTARKTTRDNYDPTYLVGYATLNKAALTIALKESAYTLTKVYDGKDVSVTLDKTNGLTYIGLKEGDEVNTENLVLTVEDCDEIAGKASVGTYQLTLSGATAANYNITYIPSQYKVTKKPLKVTATNQTFVVNTTATVDQSFYVIDPETPLADGDKSSEVFLLAFTTGTGSPSAALSTDGQFTATATFTDGIEIKNGGTTVTPKYGNYDINNGIAATLTNGDVTVIDAAAATTFALDDTKDLTAVLTEDVTGATVTFNARALNAEQWNVLVLPFEVPVKTLSEKLGYAVIDVLDESKDDGNVHFKLKVAGKIAANTPMMVYPDGTINNFNSIVFTGVKVVKTTDNVSVQDKGGNKFVGTYKTTGIYGQDYRYLSKGTWYNASKYTEAKPCNIKALRGYLDLTGNASAARAMIFIDEPDGTTTAIQAVTGDKIGSDVKADGWYTIGGMKLQGAPTQKGIYINNGKKIVVK